MVTDIEKLIRDAEALIAEAESSGFDTWCRAQGLDPEKVRGQLAIEANPEAERRARELFADDMADITREVESRAAALGIGREPATAQASAVRQRRRFGMV